MFKRSQQRAHLGLFLAALVLLGTPAAAFAQQADESGESAMLARINAMRAAQQLAPLERHEGLDIAAHAHSADMAMHRQLVHVSDRSGNPNDRLVAAGVEVDRIAENIARRESTLEAHQSILESDAHRAQLLDAQMTHIGLSAVVGADGVYVTQLVARIERELPPDPASVLPPPAVVDTPAPEPALPEEPAPAPLTAADPDPIAALVAQAEAQAAVEEPELVAESEAMMEVPPEPVALAVAPEPPAAPSQAAVQAQVVQLPPPFRVPARHRGVSGYWVSHAGRWWYYPAPAHTVPGQLLSADPTVQGPPPGYEQPTTQVAPTAAVAPTVTVTPATPRQVYVARRPGIRYYRPPTRVIVHRR